MKRSGWIVRKRSKNFRSQAMSPGHRSLQFNRRWATNMTHFFCEDVLATVIAAKYCFKREIIELWGEPAAVWISAPEDTLKNVLIRGFELNKSPVKGVDFEFTTARFPPPKAHQIGQLLWPVARVHLTLYSSEQNKEH